MTQDLATLDQEAERIVHEIGIPPCPAILTRLLKEMREDEPDFDKVGNMIGKDVSLAAAMLKTVNSPFYGLRTKATSVRQALALLGLRNVAQLVTGLLLRQAFPVGDSAVMERYWESSAAVAAITAQIARELKAGDRDDAYTFGLFRDCGIPLLLRKFRDYSALLGENKTLETRGFTEVEDECFHVNHARVGRELAASWMLPDHTCDAILYHHDYAALTGDALPLRTRNLVALALAAEWGYCTAIAETKCYEWAKGGAAALAVLGTDEKTILAYAEDAAAGLDPA